MRDTQQQTELSGLARYHVARNIRGLLRQPQFCGLVYGVYLHPETYKINVVVHPTVEAAVRSFFDLVPVLSVINSVELATGSTIAIEPLGLKVDEIEARYALGDTISDGLRSSLSGALRRVMISPITNQKKYIFLFVEPDALSLVATMFENIEFVEVVPYNEELHGGSP